MIDPKLQSCSNCGYTWKPGLLQKIIMLIFGEYTKTCPRCQSRITLKFIGHVVKVDTVNVNKNDIWRNG